MSIPLRNEKVVVFVSTIKVSETMNLIRIRSLHYEVVKAIVRELVGELVDELNELGQGNLEGLK